MIVYLCAKLIIIMKLREMEGEKNYFFLNVSKVISGHAPKRIG